MENQASFTQPVIVQQEIDIEVSEVCFVISISKCGWNSRWKKMQHIVNIQKKKKNSLNKICFPLLTLTFTRFPWPFSCAVHTFFCVSENSLPSMLSRHSVFLYAVTVCAGIQLFIYQWCRLIVLFNQRFHWFQFILIPRIPVCHYCSKCRAVVFSEQPRLKITQESRCTIKHLTHLLHLFATHLCNTS